MSVSWCTWLSSLIGCPSPASKLYEQARTRLNDELNMAKLLKRVRTANIVLESTFLGPSYKNRKQLLAHTANGIIDMNDGDAPPKENKTGAQEDAQLEGGNANDIAFSNLAASRGPMSDRKSIMSIGRELEGDPSVALRVKQPARSKNLFYFAAGSLKYIKLIDAELEENLLSRFLIDNQRIVEDIWLYSRLSLSGRARAADQENQFEIVPEPELKMRGGQVEKQVSDH